MENATNALLIAGGVLIAIVIISLGVSLYSLFSNQSKGYSQIMAETELQKFNSKFEVYIGRTDITAQEIVSIVNLSKKNGDIVGIYLGTTKLNTTMSSPEDFLTSNLIDASGNQILFSCKYVNSGANISPKYDIDGRINKLVFTKNT